MSGQPSIAGPEDKQTRETGAGRSGPYRGFESHPLRHTILIYLMFLGVLAHKINHSQGQGRFDGFPLGSGITLPFSPKSAPGRRNLVALREGDVGRLPRMTGFVRKFRKKISAEMVFEYRLRNVIALLQS